MANLKSSVLVVDDNEDGAELLAALVESMGHAARIATSGQAALALLSDASAQIAIIDLSLPDMDGYELAQLITSEYSPGCRVVMLTGFGSEEHRRRALEAGCCSFVVKPIQIPDLEALLTELSVATADRPVASEA